MTPEQRAKIKWHCRRGMLELDVILERFVEQHLNTLTGHKLQLFEALLKQSDPDLYAWLMGYAIADEQELQEIVTFIRHCDPLP